MTQKVIDVPMVVLTIPSLGAQVLTGPSGAIILAIPSDALIPKDISALPDLLPAFPAVADLLVSDEVPDLDASVEPYTNLVDRGVCTLQLAGLRVLNQQCLCVIPCIRLKPLPRVVVLAPSAIGTELKLHAARAAGPGGAMIFRATR